MAKLTKEELLKAIAEMSVMEVVDLIAAMEEKFGVSAAASAVAVAAPAASAAADDVVKDSFDVILTGDSGNKVGAIKAVRNVTSLGLKEAKEFVESAPKPLKEGVSREEADEIVKTLKDAGIDTVEVK